VKVLLQCNGATLKTVPVTFERNFWRNIPFNLSLLKSQEILSHGDGQLNGQLTPGLTRKHFVYNTKDEEDQLCIPTLTKAKVYSEGQIFYFGWTASYGKRENYYLQATNNILQCERWKGNSPKWWGFECRCSCPDFAKQKWKTIDSNYMETICYHLQIALELCVDLRSRDKLSSPTSFVSPGRPPLPQQSSGEIGIRKRRTVSPIKDDRATGPVIIL